MDSFTYGKAARQRPSLARTPVYLVLGLLVAATLGYGVFAVTRTGGRAVVQNARDGTKQIGAAGDAQAQTNLRSALSAATTVYMDGGSFQSASATELSVLEPSFTYVDGTRQSTGPNVISVEATAQAWGGAVLSSSGTCFYIRTVGTTQAYGHGDICTGGAAIGATGSRF